MVRMAGGALCARCAGAAEEDCISARDMVAGGTHCLCSGSYVPWLVLQTVYSSYCGGALAARPPGRAPRTAATVA